MLFDDIPDDFKLNVKKYILKLNNTIKEHDNYLEINGTKCPKNIKTQHFNFKLCSDEHITLMIESFYLLHIFHEFCENNNIYYSINCGSLLSYHRENDILLWDDDIDIFISKNGLDIFIKLWNDSGIEKNIWDQNWCYKDICLGNYKIILIKSRNRENLYKIKLNNIVDNNNKIDIGGIDITYNNKNNIEGWGYDFSIVNNYECNSDNYQIIKFGPIYTRAFNLEISEHILTIYYGSNWKQRKHPSL